MATIEVDMFEWKSAIEPDTLITYGVATCIAIGVSKRESRKAWLIHSPGFGHDLSALDAMLQDCVASGSNGDGLTIWVRGGDTVVCADEVKLAQDAVIDAIEKHVPKAELELDWKPVGSMELVFVADQWQLATED